MHQAWRREAASSAVSLEWPKSSRECVIFKIAVKDPASKVLISCDTKYSLPVNTQYSHARMSVQTPTGTISAENADNFEDIEKQFAVKGEF